MALLQALCLAPARGRLAHNPHLLCLDDYLA